MSCYGAYGQRFEYIKVFGDPLEEIVKYTYFRGLVDGWKFAKEKYKEQVRDDTSQVAEETEENKSQLREGQDPLRN